MTAKIELYNASNFNFRGQRTIFDQKNEKVIVILGYNLTDPRRRHFNQTGILLPVPLHNIEKYNRPGMLNLLPGDLMLKTEAVDRTGEPAYKDLCAQGKFLELGIIDKMGGHTFNLKFDDEGIETQKDLNEYLFQHLKNNNDKYCEAIQLKKEREAAAGLLKQEALRKRRGY